VTRSGYAPVNGLRMYYEVHGEGRPLVLLPGGLHTIDLSFADLLPGLAGRGTEPDHRAGPTSCCP
jgi:pimeloyl-ACP methyl ester carboxylesterase